MSVVMRRQVHTVGDAEGEDRHGGGPPGDLTMEAARVAGVSPLRTAASLAPFRAAALRARRLPRTASPAPAAAGPRRNAPVTARHEQDQAVSIAPSAPVAGRKVTVTRAGTPRIVRVGPSARKGTRRSFLTAPYKPLRKASSGPTLACGASADPAGLTARARPKARPEAHAASLRDSRAAAAPTRTRVWRVSTPVSTGLHTISTRSPHGLHSSSCLLTVIAVGFAEFLTWRPGTRIWPVWCGNAEVSIWLKLDGVGARLVKVCATAARSGTSARPGVFITPAVVGATPYRTPLVIPGSMAGGCASCAPGCSTPRMRRRDGAHPGQDTSTCKPMTTACRRHLGNQVARLTGAGAIGVKVYSSLGSQVPGAAPQAAGTTTRAAGITPSFSGSTSCPSYCRRMADGLSTARAPPWSTASFTLDPTYRSSGCRRQAQLRDSGPREQGTEDQCHGFPFGPSVK
jgi:hypothetical protein